MTLEELFDADISGRDLPRGNLTPDLPHRCGGTWTFPEVCFVIEDATSGVQAAKAGGFAAIGVARLGDQQQLANVGADLVVTNLDDVSIPALAEGQCRNGRPPRRSGSGTRRPPDVWTLVYEGFDPARQGLREALCALGNGYFVTRGALPEAKADGVNYPGSYVAGLYNRLTTEIAGLKVENEDLSTCPTGYRWNSESSAVHGSTCNNPASKTTTSNWIWSMEH